MHLIYLIHEFHNLSWITEINELFHNILIYWDAVGVDVQNNPCRCAKFQFFWSPMTKTDREIKLDLFLGGGVGGGGW